MHDLDALRKTRIHERQPDLFVGVIGTGPSLSIGATSNLQSDQRNYAVQFEWTVR